MSLKHTQINVSVDIYNVARRYLEFARTCLTCLELRREDLIKAALYRYQHFWLPLAAKHPERALEAPIDIFWVWHCHMMSPVVYCKDCERIVGTAVGCERFMRTDEEIEAVWRETEALWNSEYGPDHPFHVELDGWVNPDYRDGQVTIDPHVYSNALRQREFGYQLSLPHHDDPGYLTTTVVRYRQFLYLKKIHPDMWVIPTYDIDFAWHAHMLCPLQYRSDMLRILGFLFNHGDVPPGLPPDAKLKYPDLITRAAWVEEFGQSVSLFGAGYRGINPVGQVDVMDTDGLALLAPRDVNIVVTNVTINTEHALTKHAKLKLETSFGQAQIPLHLQESRRKTGNGFPFPFSKRAKRDACIRFDTSKNARCIVDVSVSDKASWTRHINGGKGAFQVDMTSFVEVLKRDQPVPFENVVEMDDVTKLTIEAIAKPIRMCKASFSIQPGKRSQVAMTEDLKSMWGPIPLPEVPLAGPDVTVKMVTFEVLDSKQHHAFACRLLECKSLEQEGAQVLFHNKMVAVAHPIGGIQLPYPSHVTNRKETPTLNPLKGEQACLIKNHDGDWGIAIGHLVKEKTLTVNGTFQEEEKEYMHVVVWVLEDRRRIDFKLPNENNEHEFCVDDVNVNLSKGSFTINDPEDPVAEVLAFAFVLKLLWKMCRDKKEEGVEKIPTHRLARMGKSLIMAKRASTMKNAWT